MTADAVYDRSRHGRPGQDVRNGIWFRTFESLSMQKQKPNAAKWHDRSQPVPPGVDHGEHLLLSVTAVLLAGVSSGCSRLRNLSHGPDVDAACRALNAMGVATVPEEGGLSIWGVGNGALLAPRLPLDFTNAPVALALTAGLVAPYDMPVSLGDIALPEGVREPLHQMGVQMEAGPAGELCLHGPEGANPLQVKLDQSSSLMLKACLLLAGLNTPGITTLVEPMGASGDGFTPLEALFAAFGVELDVRPGEGGLRDIRLTGRSRLLAARIDLAVAS